METFSLDPCRWRIARVVGRNPLLRRSDRIEGLVMLVAVLAAMVAVPVTGMVAAMTYSAREHLYVSEAHERHRVVATVTEAVLEQAGTTVVQAKWPVGAAERTGTLELFSPAKPGATVDIWVDEDGKPTLAPTPGWHAVIDAAGMAGVTLLIAGFAMTSLVAAFYSRLNRARAAAWEREIRSLVEDGVVE